MSKPANAFILRKKISFVIILLIFKRKILKILYSRNLYILLYRIIKSRVIGFGSSYIFEYYTTRKITNNTYVLLLTITPAIVLKKTNAFSPSKLNFIITNAVQYKIIIND